jgi:hypothetical protein
MTIAAQEDKLTIHIAETTRFALLRVMETSSPIHSDVAFVAVEARRTLHAASSANTAELKQPVENWTVIPNIISALFFGKLIHIVWRNF